MTASAPRIDGAYLRELTAARRHEDACAAARALLQSGDADREVRYLYALNLRCLGQLTAAETFLDAFERQHPDFSRIHQERGHCHLGRRDTTAALRSFERAVAMNGSLRDSWRQLALLYARRGESSRSMEAAHRAACLDALPPALVRADSLFADGDLEGSEALLRRLAEQGIEPVTVMHLLARVRHARGAWLDAQCLFEEALAAAPDSEALRLDYVRLLLDRQRYAAAAVQIERLPQGGSTPTTQLMRATASLALGKATEAIALLQRLIAAQPTAVAWLTLGDALRASGSFEASVAAYREAARAGAYGAACWSLANLKRYRFTPDDVQGMRAALAAAADPGAGAEREALLFALGDALRQAGDHDGAWRSFAAGNALHRARHPYDLSRHAGLVQALASTCNAAFFDTRRGWGAEDRDPIFIVGLPRSGSTLVEQILASHPKIDGTRELGELPALVHDLEGRRPDATGRGYPALMAELGAPDVVTAAARYLACTRPYRGAAPLFIDKLPNNFLHVGLIHLMLPHATIIDVRRNALDCCFSNLTQRYASGQEFSYDLQDMAGYYRVYLLLMQHWNAVLPGRVLTLQYESLVEDPEREVRRLLGHCRLPYDARCLRFHETPRQVATPSSEQVRQPLSKSGMGAWRPYAAWLKPLEHALGDALSL